MMKFVRKFIIYLLIATFVQGQLSPFVSLAQAQVMGLPNPGTMVALSEGFYPAVMKGLKIHPENPLQFDFIIDTGNTKFSADELEDESAKLIKYFLATLTTPENDIWVNLSPYEKNRIAPDAFGVTEMGRDLLAQDYILKQITASLIYPEKELGKKFWDKIHAQMGNVEIPVNTFNKVWIVPDQAVVYQSGNTAFITKSHLKVMLDQDYLALQSNRPETTDQRPQTQDKNLLSGLKSQQINAAGSQAIREIILPVIEKEVNEGQNFSQLRQIYNSLILATWFKRNLRESFLGKAYVNENKVDGVDIEDKEMKQKIYQQYLEAFQKGVYSYIKEEYDPVTQESIPRKYFSGGFDGRSASSVVTFEEHTGGEIATVVSETHIGNLVTTTTILNPIKTDMRRYNVKNFGSTFRQKGVELLKTQEFRKWAEPQRDQKIDFSQTELAARFGLSTGKVGIILREYNIKTKGRLGFESPRVKTFRVWAQQHKGEAIDLHMEDLIEDSNLSLMSIRKILAEYKITTKGQKRLVIPEETVSSSSPVNEEDENLTGVQRLSQFLETKSGQEIGVSQQDLAVDYDVAISTVSKKMAQYGVHTKNKKIEEFRKWTEEHRNQSVDFTYPELAKIYGISITSVKMGLKEFNITSKNGLARTAEAMQRLRDFAQKNAGKRLHVTQQTVASRYGLSYSTVNRVLDEFDVQSKGNSASSSVSTSQEDSPEIPTVEFILWAQENKDSKVPFYAQDLAEHFDEHLATVLEVISDYNIETDGDSHSRALARFRQWLEPNRDGKTDSTQRELSYRFGLPLQIIGHELAAYGVHSKGRGKPISEGAKSLRAWAEPRRGKTVPETLGELAALHGLSISTARKVLSPFDITTNGKYIEVSSAGVTPDNVGGINLNPNMLDLKTEGDQILNIPFDPQIQTLSIDGFIPVIIQMAPTNLPLLLGLKKEQAEEELAEVVRN